MVVATQDGVTLTSLSEETIMKNSTAEKLPANRGKNPRPLSVTVDVIFDENGFVEPRYVASVNDTLRFTSESGSELTVFVLTADGQSQTTQMLGTTSQVVVASMASVDKVAQSSGEYLISVEPPPQLLGANDPGGGKTVTVIINA
jgi:hypothetical protein